jgi:hypothetical protein
MWRALWTEVTRYTPLLALLYSERANSKGMYLVLSIEVPEELARFRLPDAVHARLQHLLDKQDDGDSLTIDEREEAEGLVELAEFLSLLRLRVMRASNGS